MRVLPCSFVDDVSACVQQRLLAQQGPRPGTPLPEPTDPKAWVLHPRLQVLWQAELLPVEDRPRAGQGAARGSVVQTCIGLSLAIQPLINSAGRGPQLCPGTSICTSDCGDSVPCGDSVSTRSLPGLLCSFAPFAHRALVRDLVSSQLPPLLLQPPGEGRPGCHCSTQVQLSRPKTSSRMRGRLPLSP